MDCGPGSVAQLKLESGEGEARGGEKEQENCP